MTSISKNMYINKLDDIVKGYTPDWSEDVFEIKKKVKTTVQWTYVMENLNGEELIGTFYEKEWPKTKQTQF